MIDQHQLAALPLLSGVKPAALAALGRYARERRFQSGETIFRAGAQADHLLVVTQWHVRVVRGR